MSDSYEDVVIEYNELKERIRHLASIIKKHKDKGYMRIHAKKKRHCDACNCDIFITGWKDHLETRKHKYNELTDK